jgi:hypothetical protein
MLIIRITDILHIIKQKRHDIQNIFLAVLFEKSLDALMNLEVLLDLRVNIMTTHLSCLLNECGSLSLHFLLDVDLIDAEIVCKTHQFIEVIPILAPLSLLSDRVVIKELDLMSRVDFLKEVQNLFKIVLLTQQLQFLVDGKSLFPFFSKKSNL